MPLRLYGDAFSPPARSVAILLRLNGVPFEWKTVILWKEEQHGEEFKKINPLSKVPAIDDNGFKLTESISIMKYLIRKHDLPEHWYPRQDLKKQARVEEYLDYHHLNTRAPGASLIRELLLVPRATGNPVNQQRVKELRRLVSKMVSELEMVFLKDRKYIAGDEISIADIFAACELAELLACHEHSVWETNPVVKSWMERVKQETNPHFDDYHKLVYNFQKNYKKVPSKL